MTTRKQMFIAVLWLITVTALMFWWLVHGLIQLNLLGQPVPDLEFISRQRRMLMWEGGTFAVLLILGGVWLIRLLWLKSAQSESMKLFFHVFAHDIKNALTASRLLIESLTTENISQNKKSLEACQLRLDLNTENSLLWLGSFEGTAILKEKLNLQNMVESVAVGFPTLSVSSAFAFVEMDARLLRSVLQNIFHNAVVHGQATEIKITAQSKQDCLLISFQDNGRGTEHPPATQAPKSDSRKSHQGLGLYLISQLIQKSGGRIEFPRSQRGFLVEMYLPGALP